MNWSAKVKEAAAGGATGLLVTVVYIIMREHGVTPGEWLQFAGVFFGVVATMTATLWLQGRAEVAKRKTNEAAFVRHLNCADDALQMIMDDAGDAWRYVATVDTALLHIIPAKNGFDHDSFELEVAIAALLAAWEASGKQMDAWANGLGNGGEDNMSELKRRAHHVQVLAREVLSEFNKPRAPMKFKRGGSD